MTAPFRTVEVSDPAYEVDGLRAVTVHSAALGRRADVLVFAPGGVDPDTPLPLVILLHGVYGSHWAWAFKGGAHRSLQALVDAGRVPPMALAMPSDGLWGGGSGYLPRPGEDAEAWIVDEVAQAARLALPGAGLGGVCLAGLSMGGYGALRLGACHPDRFIACAGLSSITRLDQMAYFVPEPLDAYPAPAGTENVFDLWAGLGDGPGPRPALRFDCGVDDPLFKANRALHADLTGAGVEHVYEELPGTHEWGYWSANLPRAYEFFARTLAVAT